MSTRNPDLKQPYAQWEIVDVVFPATPNTDYDVPTTLTPPSPEQVDYQVLRKDQTVDVYHDTSGTRKPWGRGFVVLRATAASAHVSLLLTVPSILRTPDFT